MSRLRRWTLGMSMLTGPSRMPNSAARTAKDATFALWIMFLLGRQATFGQEPPTILRSTNAVRCPSLDHVHPRYLPASPLPMTRTSYRSVVAMRFLALLSQHARPRSVPGDDEHRPCCAP